MVYLATRYMEPMSEASIAHSVKRVGNSYDNAIAETLIGLYKAEVIRRRGHWRHIEAVELGALEWVEWFNHRRLVEPIGDLIPVEKEEIYYQDQA